MSHAFLIFKNYTTLLIKRALILLFLKTVPTTLDCCKKNKVPPDCLGLCSPAGCTCSTVKEIKQFLVRKIRTGKTVQRFTKCTAWEAVIEACFLAKGYLVFSIF